MALTRREVWSLTFLICALLVAFTLIYLAAPARAQEEDVPTASTVSPYSARADCIVTYESHWNATAVNPRSGASGLGQFLRSTWATTPYAARSVFDAYANHAAVCWMLSVGRAREFDVVRLGLC